MKIAINTDALKIGYRIQGTGVYINQLLINLKRYFDENEYITFSRTQKLFKNVDLAHYPFFNPFFLTLPLRKSFPTIVTIHDLIPLVFPEHFPVGIKGELKWRIQKWSLKNVKAIIADSLATKKDIEGFTDTPSDKIYVIYLAAGEGFKQIESSKLKLESLRKKYSLPDKFVLYVGDVIWSKNVPNLIKAIKKINLTLVMVGKQATSTDFDKTHPWNKDLVILNNEARDDKRIIRLGFVPNEDLVAIYNLTTVFVQPSFYEGFGIPILEAMKCGAPVITTKGGSLPEVAGEAAFYVNINDVNSIADGVGEVFFNKDLQEELSQRGLKQAKKFSWEKTAKETINVYSKVLAISARDRSTFG